ncbi:MAG: helix-turn-helix transcriptional regulator [Chloroflexi bacterium]|uniref:Helix-turn-helix domain-containing protein n=1 Tax=Candidatus Chlorohelix allophototropha TaxID=3003348 RepID=A0A8T7M421_9CHLR|nr:helix-turn-helix transcriptional regulator [Chloroflexota bacterium]WJW70194.1 helix-turn-helix domain-containing protein [Chloroflexota bacterium L227-S17]
MSENNQTKYTPEAELVISDIETLKVLADPMRQRILEKVCDVPITAKQISANLKIPVTKLYYHLNMMEEHGLVKVVGTRLVSGIVEKQYQASAYFFRLDRSLFDFSKGGSKEGIDLALSTVFDITREEIKESVEKGLITADADNADAHKLTLRRINRAMSDTEAKEFIGKLNELLADWNITDKETKEQDSNKQQFTLTLAFYPVSSEETKQE